MGQNYATNQAYAQPTTVPPGPEVGPWIIVTVILFIVLIAAIVKIANGKK